MANIRKELVLSYIRKYHPSTVQDLKVKLVQDGIRSTDEGLLQAIQELQSEGTIGLHYFGASNTFVSYLLDIFTSWWIYFAIAVSLTELFLVAVEMSALPLLILRMAFGLILLGFLPGYATVQCIFPEKSLREIEQILLSIFLSVTISIAIGVALGFGYIFTAFNSVIVSSSYCTAVSLLAGYRQYVQTRPNVAGEAKR